MSNYKILIEVDGYKDVLVIKTALDPSVIDAIIEDIYSNLLAASAKEK